MIIININIRIILNQLLINEIEVKKYFFQKINNLLTIFLIHKQQKNQKTKDLFLIMKIYHL